MVNVSKCFQFFIIFYQFFIIFQGNRGKWIKTIKKLWKMIKKKWKKLETFTIFDCFRSSPEFIMFYHCFIDFLSIFYHFPRKQRKMNKNYQKMMKNDKQLIKIEKNSRHSPFLIVSEEARIYQCFIDFFLQGKRGKWITNYQKMMKNDKKW